MDEKRSDQVYLEEGWSAREIMERYSIIDPNRVSYHAEGEAMFED